MEVKATRIKFSENFLDRHFQKVLLPTRIIQHMFFLSTFSIKSNRIMPNGHVYNIISVLGMLFFIYMNLHSITADKVLPIIASGNFLTFSFILNILVCTAGHVMFYLLNVFFSNKHVQLIIIIQKSFRLIHFDKYRNIIFDNWIYTSGHVIAYLVFICSYLNISVILYYISLVCFDVYISYGVCLSKLLRSGVQGWMSEVQYYTRVSLNINNKEEKIWMKLFQVYTDLMEAFCIFKDLFQVPIFFTICDTVLHTLLYFQTHLAIDETQIDFDDGNSSRMATLFWVTRNVFLIAIFSLHCEFFYKIIEDVDEVCYRLLSINQELEGSKRLCKNVLRLNQARFKKMNAFGIFTIDSNLPKELASLTAHYVIVLIQFSLQ